jgi:hypothetical protein
VGVQRTNRFQAVTKGQLLMFGYLDTRKMQLLQAVWCGLVLMEWQICLPYLVLPPHELGSSSCIQLAGDGPVYSAFSPSCVG